MTAPSIEQRMEGCRRPLNRQPIMFQKWRDLLFLHWEFDPDEIQRTLPSGLTVDTFGGRAFLGVVPFFMRDIRPRFFPTVPGVSDFLEMNLRTYVYDQYGRPGVWFYSLDANQWLAVRVARTFFNLPYFDAQMRAEKTDCISYSVHRKGCDPESDSSFQYSEGEEVAAPPPQSIEYFLIERYVLFSVGGNGELYSGRVHHHPYPLRHVTARVEHEGVIALAGLATPVRPPDHVVMSRGVDVDIFAIEQVV